MDWGLPLQSEFLHSFIQFAKLREAMVKQLKLSLLVLMAGLTATESFAVSHKKPSLIFCCADTNDLFVALTRGGEKFSRFTNAADALNAAPSGSAVLVLADQYPQTTTALTESAFALAAEKNLR